MPGNALYSMKEWVERDWLSQLDLAFANFLFAQDTATNDLVLWAGALVSRQLGRGEVFLDLDKLCHHPGFTLAIPDDNSEQILADDLLSETDLFKNYSLANWVGALAQSSLVTTGSGNTPLVLQDHRLYLRRYWQYQQILNNEIQRRLSGVTSGLSDTVSNSLNALFPEYSQQPDWQKSPAR